MSIVIFGDLFSFPEGLAATNRIYTYGKGFSQMGINVHVICFSNNFMETPNGTVDGLYYYNPFEQKKRSNSFLARRWHKFMKYVRTWRILKNINKQDKIIAINRWSDMMLSQSFIWLLSRILGTKIITECNEHPLREYNKGGLIRLIGIFRFRLDVFFSDGILCISRYLIKFHEDRGIKKRKLLLVPSTVDPERMREVSEKPVNEFYIGYFGSLTFQRDNIGSLIRAYAHLTVRQPDARLVLGGFCPEDDRKRINALIDELNLRDKIMMIEFLSRKEIVNYIANADILVMMRARDLESAASYPSKLTEFLASGKPVVTVNVGEVSDFLQDGVNAYIVEPGNETELAERLDFVINNYELAKVVGMKGKELTENIFNYKYQAARIHQFMREL